MSLGRQAFQSHLRAQIQTLVGSKFMPAMNPQLTIVRLMSTPRPAPNADASGTEIDPEVNERHEQESKKQESKYRLFKKVFSSALFGTTIALAYYARSRRQKELSLNLEGCIRLPVDEDITGSYKEFYRVPIPATGKPTYVLPSSMVRDGTIRNLQSFQVRPDDVFVASFPKSGTTWVQEIVFLIKNDLDFQKASEKVLESRFPYLEYPYPGMSSVVSLPSPRLIKTHLPYDLLPPDVANAKIIYITRNPKDTVVSYFHFARMLAFSSYHGTFEDFVKKFKKDLVPYSPFFSHIESYTSHQDDPNVLIISYEELSRDTPETVRKIANFLEKPLSAEDVDTIVAHTDFRRMAQNPSVNYSHWDDIGIRNKNEANFMRKGQVGDWKNYFDEQLNREFDLWIHDQNKSGLSFEYNSGRN